CARDQSGFDHW
nr:immunoglobulin heavy chain junction region [Macaca mulatta]MOW79924.1 immunoglobulin heavy chain junction region [Macaca mulatta]